MHPLGVLLWWPVPSACRPFCGCSMDYVATENDMLLPPLPCCSPDGAFDGKVRVPAGALLWCTTGCRQRCLFHRIDAQLHAACQCVQRQHPSTRYHAQACTLIPCGGCPQPVANPPTHQPPHPNDRSLRWAHPARLPTPGSARGARFRWIWKTSGCSTMRRRGSQNTSRTRRWA